MTDDLTDDLDAAFKRWYASGGREETIAAGVPPDSKPAGRTDRQTLELPSGRHRELLALLRANSHRDGAGRLVSRWSQQQLAAKLHVSVRTLRNVLADLREPGSDPRHPTTKAVGLRLGLVKVEPTRRDPPVGGRVFATNLYVIVEPLPVGPTSSDRNGGALPVGATRGNAQTRRSHRQADRDEADSDGDPTGKHKTAGRTDRQTQKRRSHRRATKKAALTSGNDDGVACLEQEPKAQTITRSTVGVEPVAGPARTREVGEGFSPPVGGSSTTVRRHREGGILASVTLTDDGWPEGPPEAEVQETEAAGHRGAVWLVVPERDQLDYDPTAAQILATIAAGLGEPETVEVRPHPTYRVARYGEVNLETCSTADLHRALQGLDRDTCINSGCQPGARCPRHTPRKRG